MKNANTEPANNEIGNSTAEIVGMKENERKLALVKVAILTESVRAFDECLERKDRGEKPTPLESLISRGEAMFEQIDVTGRQIKDVESSLLSLEREMEQIVSSSELPSEEVAGRLSSKKVLADLMRSRVDNARRDRESKIAELAGLTVRMKFAVREVLDDIERGRYALANAPEAGGAKRKDNSALWRRLESRETPTDFEALNQYARVFVACARDMITEATRCTDKLGGQIPEIRTAIVEMVGTCTCGCVRTAA